MNVFTVVLLFCYFADDITLLEGKSVLMMEMVLFCKVFVRADKICFIC